jgi:long-chain acyl-CoA synthetase
LAVARLLGELGVARGERVALLLNDSPEFVAAFIAICSSGAIAVPINMALRLDEQLAILNDCSASVAVVEADLGKLLLADAREKLSHLRQVVVVGRDDKELSAEDSEEHGDEDRREAHGVV